MNVVDPTPGELLYAGSRYDIKELYGDRDNEADHQSTPISPELAAEIYGDGSVSTGEDRQLNLFDALQQPSTSATATPASVHPNIEERDRVSEQIHAKPTGSLDPRSARAASLALKAAARRGELGPRTTGHIKYRT